MKIEVSGSVIGLCVLVALLVFSPGSLTPSPSTQTHSNSAFYDPASDRVTEIPNSIPEGKADADSDCEHKSNLSPCPKPTLEKIYPINVVTDSNLKNKAIK